MKIHHSRRWGIVLALLSTTPLVASQQSCSSPSECPKTQYCNSVGTCMNMGGCAKVLDCSDETNVFGQALCIGTQFCENETCGIACGVDVEAPLTDSTPVDPRFKCTTTSDCSSSGEFYCRNDGICEKMGYCGVVEDCSLDDNQGYPIAPCFGGMECMNRKCEMNCHGGSDALYACETSADCPEQPDMYCNSYDTCQKTGTCVIAEDCSLQGNSFMSITCVGTQFCDEMGMCGKQCTESTEGDPVDPPPKPAKGAEQDGPPFLTSCSSDDDCNGITALTTRAAVEDPMYCAQGTCKKHGTCTSDSDCMNPSNNIWSDPRCFGYLYCTKEGTCDRNCGKDCKNRQSAASCLANACDTADWSECDGAASCITNSCDGGCHQMLFNAAGEVLPGCTVAADGDVVNFNEMEDTKAGAELDRGNDPKEPTMESANTEDSKSETEPNMEDANTEETKSETDTEQEEAEPNEGADEQDLETSNLESSANRTTQLFAILAAIFVATTF